MWATFTVSAIGVLAAARLAGPVMREGRALVTAELNR
jgi:hypothetical protein